MDGAQSSSLITFTLALTVVMKDGGGKCRPKSQSQPTCKVVARVGMMQHPSLQIVAPSHSHGELNH